MAHCLDLSDVEVALVAKEAAKIVVNPESNLNNLVQPPNVRRFLEKGMAITNFYTLGVTVGLGTDGVISDMLHTLKTTAWLQKHAYGLSENVCSLF